jgi:hypothetical protein
MSKNQFNKLVVRYIVKTKNIRIENMFTKQVTIETVIDGEQHIFEVKKDGKGDESLSFRSFCKMARADVGEQTKTYTERQPGAVCQECLNAWKQDARSPWFAWQAGQKIS